MFERLTNDVSISQECTNHRNLLDLMTYVIESGMNVSSLNCLFCILSALVTYLIARKQSSSEALEYCVSVITVVTPLHNRVQLEGEAAYITGLSVLLRCL